MDEKQKQQAELKLFNHYIQGLSEIKKDLEKIKQITDLEEKYNEVSFFLSGHSNKYGLASGHYSAGDLHEISGCSLKLNEYEQLINELRSIKTETFKQLKATQCHFCQRKGLTSPYIYKEEEGYKTVFCNQTCFNQWNEEKNKLPANDTNKVNSENILQESEKNSGLAEREREREMKISNYHPNTALNVSN